MEALSIFISVFALLMVMGLESIHKQNKKQAQPMKKYTAPPTDEIMVLELEGNMELCVQLLIHIDKLPKFSQQMGSIGEAICEQVIMDHRAEKAMPLSFWMKRTLQLSAALETLKSQITPEDYMRICRLSIGDVLNVYNAGGMV